VPGGETGRLPGGIPGVALEEGSSGATACVAVWEGQGRRCRLRSRGAGRRSGVAVPGGGLESRGGVLKSHTGNRGHAEAGWEGRSVGRSGADWGGQSEADLLECGGLAGRRSRDEDKGVAGRCLRSGSSGVGDRPMGGVNDPSFVLRHV
jgi:hypothetical protein